jgi:hypothetical protein
MEETTESEIRKNLLRHFYDISKQDKQDMAQAVANLKSAKPGADMAHTLLDTENFVPRTPSEIGKYAICCFTFTPESVIAEDQFSHATYNQDGVQNRNGDATVFDFIITEEYEVVDEDVVAPMPDKPKLYPGRAALEHAPHPCKRGSADLSRGTMCFGIGRNDSLPIWAPMNQGINPLSDNFY